MAPLPSDAAAAAPSPRRSGGDTYTSWTDLCSREREGHDYRIHFRPAAGSRFAIVAPHGGGIEPGTSELATAIAGAEHSLYLFEGLKATGNGSLHITSSRFDEPVLAALLTAVATVVTVHGADDLGEVAWIGGTDQHLGARMAEALTAARFEARRSAALPGRDPLNICNRGRSGKGVQFELSNGLRSTFFRSLSARGRTSTTDRFDHFVTAIRNVVSGADERGE